MEKNEMPTSILARNNLNKSWYLEMMEKEYRELAANLENAAKAIVLDEWRQHVWPERYELKCDYCQMIQPGEWNGGPCRYCGAPIRR